MGRGAGQEAGRVAGTAGGEAGAGQGREPRRARRADAHLPVARAVILMSKVEVRMSSAVPVGQRKALWRASVCAVAAIFGALVGQTLSAQTTSGSGSGGDALGIFQGLSADQQQQIMERLNGGGAG